MLRDERAAEIVAETENATDISLDASQLNDAINIATGRFSPLTGFLCRNDFLKVVHDMTLEDGTAWSLPIVLDVCQKTSEELSPGERVKLVGPEGNVVGAIDVEDVYKYNKRQTAEAIYGTNDDDHPGVASHLNKGDYLVGGDIFLFKEMRYNDHDLRPVESRVLFRKLGWETVVGFQTRNAPHRAHEYIQKTALENVDGLLVQPKLGDKKVGDYRDEVILGAYERLIDNYYPPESVTLSVFPSKMRYAGPREAVFDAIVRKNQGCTHFVIGHDHAGVGDYYGAFESQEVFEQIGDVGIEPLYFTKAFYCEDCDGMVSEKTCPHDEDARVLPRGSKIRRLVREGHFPSEKIMRPEVTEYVVNESDPFVDETPTQEVTR